MWSLTIVLPQPFRRFTSQIGRDVVFWSEVWPYPKTNLFNQTIQIFLTGIKFEFFFLFLFFSFSLCFSNWSIILWILKKKKNFTYLLFQFPINPCEQSIFISLLIHFVKSNMIWFWFWFCIVVWKSSAKCFLSWIISWKFQILSKKERLLHKHKHKRYIVMNIYLSFKYNIKNEISKKTLLEKRILPKSKTIKYQ